MDALPQQLGLEFQALSHPSHQTPEAALATAGGLRFSRRAHWIRPPRTARWSFSCCERRALPNRPVSAPGIARRSQTAAANKAPD